MVMFTLGLVVGACCAPFLMPIISKVWGKMKTWMDK